MEFINQKGGFTVIGWYKRGEINDMSNDDSNNEVESSEIGYHIVCIYPTDKKLLTSPDLLEKKMISPPLTTDIIICDVKMVNE